VVRWVVGLRLEENEKKKVESRRHVQYFDLILR
jgi:hypothetical protein